jgi:hypothetical protein
MSVSGWSGDRERACGSPPGASGVRLGLQDSRQQNGLPRGRSASKQRSRRELRRSRVTAFRAVTTGVEDDHDGTPTTAARPHERFLELNRDPRRQQVAREKLRTLRGEP